MSKKGPATLTLPEGISDPYAELDLNADDGASAEAISKSYKLLARKFHPDKQVRASQEQKAAAEERFLRVKAAHDFLSDETQKGLFDESRRKRTAAVKRKVEREDKMDSRRRAMKQRLDEQELASKKAAASGFSSAHAPSSSSSSSSSSSDAHEARKSQLRAENLARRQEAGISHEQRAAAAMAAAAASAAKKERKQAAATLDRQRVQVKWKRKVHSFSDDSLAVLFSRFGHVVGVDMEGTKGNAAIVTFESPDIADAAAAAYVDSDSMKVTVVAFKHGGNVGLPAKTSNTSTSASASSVGGRQGSISSRDSETVDDFNARRAAERERLIREMEQEEGGDGGVTKAAEAPYIIPPRPAAGAAAGGDAQESSSSDAQHAFGGEADLGGEVKLRTPMTKEALEAKEAMVFAVMRGQQQSVPVV